MKTVIFDVDGVLLSEKRYFDVSGLTLWEWYNSPLYLGLGEERFTSAPSEERIIALRRYYWADDMLLRKFKSHGINSNWDMVYLHVLLAFLLRSRENKELFAGWTAGFTKIEGVRAVGALLKKRGFTVAPGTDLFRLFTAIVPEDTCKDEVFPCMEKALSDEGGLALQRGLGLHGPLWCRLFECFQNWFLGDVFYRDTYHDEPYNVGKKGFLQCEVTLGGAAETKAMFRELKRRGYRLAIGTGRAAKEVEVPFKTYDWLTEFDADHIATATDVKKAEKQLGIPLDKPNPFVYYAGAFGRYEARYRDYLLHPEVYKQGEYIIVGDSPADVRCAKAMGAVMIAVLTGLDGEQARTVFERENADYIVGSVLDIPEILL